MSEKLVAFCGLVCTECPAYLAKRANDNEIRKRAAKEWSSDEFPLEIGEINCDGCMSEALFKYCKICQVRTCGTEKGVLNCAYCTEYSCDNLEGLWAFLKSPGARETLDELRKAL